MRSDNEMPKERQIEARFQKVDSNKKLDLCPVQVMTENHFHESKNGLENKVEQ